ESKLKPRTKDIVNKALYTTFKPGKTSYKVMDLHPKLRIWHKILLNCINQRPKGSSPDYINFNQKAMLFFIQDQKKICLPYFLFSYLKECIRKSRTTASIKSAIKYIPFGRLLSDLFIESGLIQDLINAGCTEDLTTIVSDVFTANSLKKMGLVKKKIAPAHEDTSSEIRSRRVPLNDYPLWTQADHPEAIRC
ncbi:hypothetical protein, partial [Bradyrhizobium sp. TM233]|uniref:hypothetical protein n=1 Tax=Bradyrhizobium sp. TM233 TaxID=2599801 RepID=UPI0030C71466